MTCCVLDASAALAMILAERHSLTVYDTSYLELALRLGLPLATRDEALQKAMTVLGVPSR